MFCYGVELLFRFDLSPNTTMYYVGPAVTEWIYEPVGLIRVGFSAVGLFLDRKSKISHEQNVEEFQFYICIPNFRPLGSIIKKKYRKVAYPLKGTNPKFWVKNYKNKILLKKHPQVWGRCIPKY